MHTLALCCGTLDTQRQKEALTAGSDCEMKEDDWKPEELDKFLNGIDRKTTMASDPDFELSTNILCN